MIDGEILTIGPGDLVAHVLQIKHDGYRLIQICATTTKEGYELTYSFGRGYEMAHLRLIVGPHAQIMSISNIYEPAFLYENEITDLFGVPIQLISPDYKGKLYRIEQQTPFK